MPLFIKKKERTLLLQSNVIAEYSWFRSFLEENERIPEDIVYNLDAEKQSFLNNMLNHLVKQSVEEWIGDPEYPADDMGSSREGWIRCSLCGQPNRYIFYVHNSLNGNSINVGSDCVKEFGINVEHSGMSVDQLIKQASRIRKLNRLNGIFPGIDKIIKGWQFDLYKLPVLIPMSLEKPYLELGEKANHKLEDYLSSRSDDIDHQEFAKILSEREELFREINAYVENNFSDDFVPRKEIGSWLERDHRIDVLNMLKKDGRITWGTAHRIEEPDFMKMLVPYFNNALDSIGARIEKIDKDKSGYVITADPHARVKLFCMHSKFVFDYGYILFNEDPIEDDPLTIERIVKICNLYDEKSINAALSELAFFLKDGTAKLWGSDFEYNELVIHFLQEDSFMLIGLKSFVEEFKSLIWKVGEKTTKDVVEYIGLQSSRRFSREDFFELYSRYRDADKRM